MSNHIPIFESETDLLQFCTAVCPDKGLHQAQHPFTSELAREPIDALGDWPLIVGVLVLACIVSAVVGGVK